MNTNTLTLTLEIPATAINSFGANVHDTLDQARACIKAALASYVGEQDNALFHASEDEDPDMEWIADLSDRAAVARAVRDAVATS